MPVAVTHTRRSCGADQNSITEPRLSGNCSGGGLSRVQRKRGGSRIRARRCRWIGSTAVERTLRSVRVLSRLALWQALPPDFLRVLPITKFRRSSIIPSPRAARRSESSHRMVSLLVRLRHTLSGTLRRQPNPGRGHFGSRAFIADAGRSRRTGAGLHAALGVLNLSVNFLAQQVGIRRRLRVPIKAMSKCRFRSRTFVGASVAGTSTQPGLSGLAAVAGSAEAPRPGPCAGRGPR